MDDLWAGYPSQRKKFEETLAKAEKRMDEFKADITDKNEDPYKPKSLYSRQGSVGVVKIEGSLIKGEANAIYQYFGLQGYDNIKAALVEAVMDKDAQSIMLYVDSGGGSVAGVRDTAQFIKTVGKVKPIYAYSEFAASAAYWLASASDHIITSETGINGSIGVLRIHTEYSKAEEQEGITTKVLRAGQYKALLNPYEPLSAEGETQAKGMLEDLYAMFVTDVAENLGTTYANVDRNMAQGKEFLGVRGKEVGIVHEIGTLETALAYGEKIKPTKNDKLNRFVSASIDNSSKSQHNASVCTQTGNNMKHNLIKEQLEALASGVPLEEVLAGVESVVGETTAKTPADATAATLPENPQNDAETLAKVESELVAAKAELDSLKTQVQALTEKADKSEASASAMRSIVEASITQMCVALNRTVNMSAMSHVEVVAAYATTKADLSTAFKSGGVAKSTASVVEEQPTNADARANQVFLQQAKSLKV